MAPILPSSDKLPLKGLGVAASEKDVFLYYAAGNDESDNFRVATSQNGIDLTEKKTLPEIKDNQRRKIDIDKCSDFRISLIDKGHLLIYRHSGKQQGIYAAISNDLIHFRRLGKLSPINTTAVVSPQHKYHDQYILYYGEKVIQVAYSKDLLSWQTDGDPVLRPGNGQSGTYACIPATAVSIPDGIILFYYALSNLTELPHYSLKAVVFDKKDPRKILWQSDLIWEQTEEMSALRAKPMGVALFQGRLVSYWDIPNKGFFAVTHAPIKYLADTKKSVPSILLKRIKDNPIIKPIVHHLWESKATFNPAAVFESGKVHLIYRAVGDFDTSVLGYATSQDGTTIDERSDDPIYVPVEPFETPEGAPVSLTSPFISGGGGYGGCEDPRLTKIDDTFYLTYVAYDGKNPPRVALTSIEGKDFRARNWNWKRSVLISPPDVVDKNAVIFPEKINGKYVIMHRIFPNILVDFVDSLDFDGTVFLKGEHIIQPSRYGWDSRKVGAGAPPIKTPYGWLLIYHAVGEQDSGRYKMGAMLLDLDDPTKVIARSIHPILAPDDRHENEGWKAGVAYPCGSVILDNQLIVYYGGADMVVCVATADATAFIHGILETGSTKLEPLALHAPSVSYGNR